MALNDFFSLGGVEVANAVRLNAYLKADAVGSPLAEAAVCACPTLTAEMLGDEPYVNPETDNAPWYDPSVPESADFAGFLPLTIEGLDEYPVKRSVTNAITGGGVLGPARALPRTITVTGILLGATCCAVEYGFHFLSEVLQGCAGNQCDGDCMEIYTCCPGEEMTEQCFQEQHRRTLRRVALVDGPRVIERVGDGCTAGECSKGADILTVEFTLVAATPWLWTDVTPVLEMRPPRDDSDTCVTWCLKGTNHERPLCIGTVDSCTTGLAVPVTAGACAGLAWPVDETVDECDETCRFLPCVDATETCSDNRCQPPTPPTVAQLDTCFCIPLAVEQQCCDVDLTECPAWSVDTPVMTLRAGSTDLRNVKVTIYERDEDEKDLTCVQIAAAKRCDAIATYIVAYVPAGGALTLDGQTGRAIVECGGTCESSKDVYGEAGGPVTFPTMGCSTYVVCIESDVSNPPAHDSMFTMGLSGRGF